MSDRVIGAHRILIGDMRDRLAELPTESVDACVTDPPYGLTQRAATTYKSAFPGRYDEAEYRGGFMGMKWDGSGVELDPATWVTIARVLKPGGHLLAFGGTRTVHRIACAIEDAGFEIRDTILYWGYFSGFPKSRNLSGEWQGWGSSLKPGYEPILVCRKPLVGTLQANAERYGTGALNIDASRIEGAAWSRPNRTTALGRMNDDGWVPTPMDGESHPQGRWPANVILGHAPDCRRVGTKQVASNGHYPKARGIGGIGNDGHAGQDDLTERYTAGETVEAWECVDDCPIRLLDQQTGDRKAGGAKSGKSAHAAFSGNLYGAAAKDGAAWDGFGDTGGGSRFFLNVAPDLAIDDPDLVPFRYSPKASRSERNAGLEGMPAKMLRWSAGEQNPGSFQSEGTNKHAANHHPTVKPINLMRWLVRLVTPPSGTVLDPFAGSGTTGIAAALEGFTFVGCELSPEYVEIAERRMTHWIREHNPRTDDLPLFAGMEMG